MMDPTIIQQNLAGYFRKCFNLHVHMVVKLYHLLVSSIMLQQQLCTERLPNYSFATFTYVNS